VTPFPVMPSFQTGRTLTSLPGKWELFRCHCNLQTTIDKNKKINSILMVEGDDCVCLVLFLYEGEDTIL